MADTKKSWLGLLNGIARHDYYNEADITDELLKEQLYPASSDDEFAIVTQKARSIIKSMSMTDMDIGQAEAFLTSQTKKRDGGLTEEQATILLKFWKSHKERIHESLVSECVWGSKLTSLSWRVDVKSRTRQSDATISEPCAIVELQLDHEHLSKDKKVEVVCFELTDSGLSKVLESLRDIETLITDYTKQEIIDINSSSVGQTVHSAVVNGPPAM